MTFARSKSKEGPDRLRRRLLAAGAAAALCPAHALAGHREDLQQDWDVIVIGTGMAGLTAAVSAREAGAVRVLLLEKGPLVGGHTLYAAGSVAVLSPRRQAPIGFTDSVELWIQDAIKAGGTVLRPHITRIATESEAAVDWLEGLGLVMTRTAYQAVGDMHPRSVTALGLAAGRRFVIALHENARMLGVTTALNTRAVRLGRAEEDGLVRVAVKRTLPGGEVRDEVLRAGGIVIATGGFTADVGRRLLYDDRLTVDVPTTANPQGLYFDGATGDGLDLGAMVGGHTVGMSNIILLPYAGGRSSRLRGRGHLCQQLGRALHERGDAHLRHQRGHSGAGRPHVLGDHGQPLEKGRHAWPQASRRHGAPLEHDRGRWQEPWMCPSTPSGARSANTTRTSPRALTEGSASASSRRRSIRRPTTGDGRRCTCT